MFLCRKKSIYAYLQGWTWWENCVPRPPHNLGCLARYPTPCTLFPIWPLFSCNKLEHIAYFACEVSMKQFRQFCRILANPNTKFLSLIMSRNVGCFAPLYFQPTHGQVTWDNKFSASGFSLSPLLAASCLSAFILCRVILSSGEDLHRLTSLSQFFSWTRKLMWLHPN